jgi:hypothetical protein
MANLLFQTLTLPFTLILQFLFKAHSLTPDRTADVLPELVTWLL